MVTTVCSVESTLETRAPLGLSPAATVCVRRLLLGSIKEIDPTNLQLEQWSSELSPELVFLSPLSDHGAHCRPSAIRSLIGESWMCGLRAIELMGQSTASEVSSFAPDKQEVLCGLWNQAIGLSFAAERLQRSIGGVGDRAWLCSLLLGLSGVSKALMLSRMGASIGRENLEVTWTDVDFLCRQFEVGHLSAAQAAIRLGQTAPSGTQESAGRTNNKLDDALATWLSWEVSMRSIRATASSGLDSWLTQLDESMPAVQYDSAATPPRYFSRVDSAAPQQPGDASSPINRSSQLSDFASRLLKRDFPNLKVECDRLGGATFTPAQ